MWVGVKVGYSMKVGEGEQELFRHLNVKLKHREPKAF